MKRAALIFDVILIIILLASCSSARLNSYNKNINGNWQLKTLVTEGITENANVSVFNEADFQCFIGSRWNFNRNDKTGNYSLSSGSGSSSCASVTRSFRWIFYEAK